MKVEVVLRGIRQLLSQDREGNSILKSLGRSLDTFEAFLQDSSQAELKVAIQAAVDGIKIPEREIGGSLSQDDIILYCRFTMQGLALLCLLDEALKSTHAQDLASAEKLREQSSQGPPPVPKTLLSPAEEKTINALLQFVVALGVFSYLLPGTDRQLRVKLGPMASQISKSSDTASVRTCYLYHHTKTLARMFTTPVIGPSVLSRHLSTVLVALLQICYGPQETPRQPHNEGCVRQCRGELSALLGRLHQPLVVRELLGLQGSPGNPAGKREKGGAATPRWLQSACGQLLSERLMQKDGVHKVLLGIFEAMPGGEEVGSGCQGDWKKVRAVARIISSCPSQASSLSDYYSTIAPQLLKLLGSPVVASVQVAAAAISLMMSQQPELARTHLMSPLTLPLKLVTTSEQHPLPTGIGNDVKLCIESLHRLCGAVEPSSPVIYAIHPFLPVIFEVWRAVNEAYKQFRSEVTSLLVGVINSLDSSSVMQFLRHVSGMPSTEQEVMEWATVSSAVSMECLSEGCVLCVKSVSGDVEEVWSVERMERVGQAVLRFVGTELKSNRFLGHFFLDCLTSVVAFLCLDTDYQPQLSSVQKVMNQLSRRTNTSATSSTLLLDIERKMGGASSEEAYQRSLVLYLAAALSENMTEDVLEQSDTVQLLSVLSVAVKCHARVVTSRRDGLTSSSSSPLDLLLIQPDLNRMLGGPITLSIALGYLSAILGGAKKVEKEQRSLLTDLLQSLEVISTGYPEAELGALAGDLRVFVATLGAVWSVEMKEAAKGRRKRGETDTIVSGLKQGHQLHTVQEVRKETDVDDKKGSSHCHTDRSDKCTHKLIEEIPEETTPRPKPQLNEEDDASRQSAFQRALAEAYDCEIPVKGHGLTTLAKLLEAGDKETVNNSTFLLHVFKQSILHSDSYVYLGAIRGLVALASRQPRAVLTTLCEEYAMFGESSSAHNQRRVDRETGQLKRTIGQKPLQESEKRSIEISFELRLKLGEALVRVARDCGEMLPHYADMVLAAVLSNARDPHPLIRSSTLSNLAEICQLLGHSFGNIHNEVLSCVSQLLLSDPTPQVQQAALLVFNLLLKGLSHRTVDILGDSLRDIYRLLKRVEGERERDELTRTHARAALGQLDDVMRDWAFPQQTLTKHITIK